MHIHVLELFLFIFLIGFKKQIGLIWVLKIFLFDFCRILSTDVCKKQSVICIRALLENSIASMYDVYDMSMKKMKMIPLKEKS